MTYFSIFLGDTRYFSNVLERNQINFECFEYKYETFQMFCTEIRNKFQMFCFEIRYFSNVSGQEQILFNCFGYKHEVFRIFSIKIQHFSNVLDQEQILSNVLYKNTIHTSIEWFPL